MKILLGVTGSISAYKSIDLARSFIKRGHECKVVLTQGALNFVKAETFKHLDIDVYLPNDDFISASVLHIQLARWADTLFIAPLSANTLSHLATGACPDLLTSIWLSARPEQVKIIAPAMNTFMLQNSITQENLKVILNQNTSLISPDSGMLACGDVGEGKLPEISVLVNLVESTSNKRVNKRVVITAGATLSNIDTIRYVTNPARGGSALCIAKKYLKEGYFVHVIKGKEVVSGFNSLLKHPRYSQETVITTQDLLNVVKKIDFDIYISPMAVSDLEFETASHKLKKSAMNNALPFKTAPDVLSHVVKNKKASQKIVGFAAESSLSEEVIQEKLSRKPVDLLVANIADGGLVSGEAQGFGTTHGTYKLISSQQQDSYENLSKEDLADLIFKQIQ